MGWGSGDVILYGGMFWLLGTSQAARRGDRGHLQGVHPNSLLVEIIHEIPAREGWR